MPGPDRHALVGTRLPDGAYDLDAERHRRWVEAVFAADWSAEVAHPMYLYLVAHCGMGVSLMELLDLLATSPDSGVMFGQGELTFERPLRIGATYRVSAEIASVERKEGASIGAFDLVTCRQEIADGDGVVGVCHETYVVPVEEEG